MALPLFVFPRESVELVALTVDLDGTAVTDYSVSVVPRGGRPIAWHLPDTAGSSRGYLTGQLSAGVYELWVRVIDNPEIPTRPHALLQIE